MTTPALTDDPFKGDNAKLIYSINALVDLSDKGALVPHNLSYTARTYLVSAALRLSAGASAGAVKPYGWIVKLKYGHDRWSGELFTDVLPPNDDTYKLVQPLYTARTPEPVKAGDAVMREAFVHTLASLAAAISLLERTPQAKKSAPSDKMFGQMIVDYKNTLEAGRKVALSTTAPQPDNVNPGPSDTAPAEPVQYVVRKNGYFYRPKAHGYTSHICEAGHWPKAEAEKYANAREGVTIHPASEFPHPPRSVDVEAIARVIEDHVHTNSGVIPIFGIREAARSIARMIEGE